MQRKNAKRNSSNIVESLREHVQRYWWLSQHDRNTRVHTHRHAMPTQKSPNHVQSNLVEKGRLKHASYDGTLLARSKLAQIAQKKSLNSLPRHQNEIHDPKKRKWVRGRNRKKGIKGIGRSTIYLLYRVKTEERPLRRSHKMKADKEAQRKSGHPKHA